MSDLQIAPCLEPTPSRCYRREPRALPTHRLTSPVHEEDSSVDAPRLGGLDLVQSEPDSRYSVDPWIRRLRLDLEDSLRPKRRMRRPHSRPQLPHHLRPPGSTRHLHLLR
jgi:hypothetical protein